MSGSSVFPVPSSITSYSSQPPVNASSVLLDGQLVISGTYTTTISGPNAPVYLYTNGVAPAVFTISGNTYTPTAGVVTPTTSIVPSGSIPVRIDASFGSSTFTTTTMSGATTWTGIGYGNNIFVAVANGTSLMSYSTDGISWINSTLPSSDSWCSVAYGVISGTGYYMVIAGSAGNDSSALPTSSASAYSTNGFTWTATALPANQLWTGVTFGNNKFIAVAGYTFGSYFATSTNGTTWSSSTSGALSSSITYGVISGTGYYVATALSNPNIYAITYSTNGSTWTSVSYDSQPYVSVAYGTVKNSNTFVAVAGGNIQQSTSSIYSTNATSWAGGTLPYNAYWYNVVCGNGTFFAFGSAVAAYSTNGYTWTAFTSPGSNQWINSAYHTILKRVALVGNITSQGAYGSSTQQLPVAFGIYNSPVNLH